MIPVSRIHATPVSTGGGILLGVLLLVVALAWIAAQAGHTPIQFAVFFFLSVGVGGYFMDAWSESLSLENGILFFDSLLRPKRRINVCAMRDVLLVHEGLNQERGIVTAVFRASDGATHRLALGPLWRKRDLDRFFSSIEQVTGECRLIDTLR